MTGLIGVERLKAGPGERLNPPLAPSIKLWGAYSLMTASWATAVLLQGGVHPQQWVWSGLGISGAALLAATWGSKCAPSGKWGLTLMATLLAWMMFQMVPLPPPLVARLTPEHWHALAAARAFTGQDIGAWVSLSVAPSATFERLLDVVPAMAAFVVAREMAWWWRTRIWIAVAPIVGMALLESLLGLAQFNSLRATAGGATGTYVNRNHFAGLLEMAFPIAVALAVSAWRKGALESGQTTGPVLRMTFLLAASACLLAGVVASLSRMGFLAILASVGFTLLMVSLSRDETGQPAADWRHGWRRGWRWGAPVLVPFAMIVLLPTRGLILRFADTASTQEASMHDRLEIWHDTFTLIGAYKWTGCGLGAYGHCFYPYQTAVPVSTVDFAHNDYLQILAELGIPGSLLVAVLAGWIVMRTLAVVLWNRAARNWELSIGLMASLVTLAVHSLADFNLYIPANALALAWLSGVAVSPGLGRR